MARGRKVHSSDSTTHPFAKSAEIPNSIDENAALDASELLTESLPRVLIVSRRTMRKSKFVDFVGEYHLDLVVKYGAVPIIVPRVQGLHNYLDSFEPIHGVLLCEGEDIDPEVSGADMNGLSPDEIEEIRAIHSSDSAIDKAKDSIELLLAKRCLERNIPYLGICRGSQVLNVACGGSLYQDVELELSRKVGIYVKHMDYSNYDGHRHKIKVVQGTPLEDWFYSSLKENGADELNVNSYHHQGIRKLAPRFKPMAHAPDGLVEAFYDPDTYDPSSGKFIVGLQFHPERMRHYQDADLKDLMTNVEEFEPFDYPGCPCAYQEFARAVIAYQQKEMRNQKPQHSLAPMNEDIERQRRDIIHSFTVARQMYDRESIIKKNSSEHGSDDAFKALTMERSRSQQDLRLGADFLEEATSITVSQSRRLKQVGATVRNASLVLESLGRKPRQVAISRDSLVQMDSAQLQELMNFHLNMADAAKELLLSRGIEV